MSSLPIIEIKSLVKVFGAFKAVDNLSFTVFKGDVFGFLGPNGAGKSSTIRMMLSLINPTAGEISIFGKSLLNHRKSILEKIGSIVEKPDFYPHLSAERNLLIFATMSGVSVTRKKVHEVLELVGLKGRERDKIKNYSHGMKQRLGIAQTLIHDPELIILDEPTTGLDPQGIIDIRNLILYLKNEKGKTIVLSSHILSEVELIATRMVIINKGKSMAEGSVKELLNSEDLVISINVDNPLKAMNLLEASPWSKSAKIETSSIVLHAAHEDIPEINRILMQGSLKVYGIESRRKLEDYFLKLLQEAV